MFAATMMKKKSDIEQFLDNPDNRRVLEQEKLVVEVTELLVRTMEIRGVSRTELAKRLGRSKAFVTQVLRGTHNMTLRTLADFFSALDSRLVMEALPYDASVATPQARWTFDSELCWRHAQQAHTAGARTLYARSRVWAPLEVAA